ncbi:DMT family transporter [Jiangella rhizosphaerae]|uniref:QacE family quaternary ammonium compound efflux SMR transporter n=1 Tax=Jiangella rhizosphaerae TaxID=2293569 RepID=A0A418KWV9_9ACTN|nr:multidrug efflux SMR transporter [Jiangella rhizosphaerae]RIQ34189.1 QacE family quaternary ammonium compound efflux SMR transporter [Jiangella rhizosphaerae]
MAWLYVIVGGLFETAFAVSLKESHGFTRLWPTLSFAVSVTVSMLLLGLGLRDIPVGTAYAVWTGIGAAGTAIVGMLFFEDPATFLRIAAIGLIVCGVILLNLAGGAAH